MINHRAIRAGTVIVLFSAGVATAMAADWAQWRGPNGQGISPDTGFPTSWSSTEHVLWKTELPGSGLSSPIVVGDYVFLTAQVEGAPVANPSGVTRTAPDPQSVGSDRAHRLQVIAVHASTGAIRWVRTAHDGPVYDARFARSSFAAPTPVSDGSLIFAYFGPEGLFAYDFSGALVWRVREQFRVKGVGTGTSPVLFGNLVILQRDEEDGAESVIVAYDKRTGREVWRTRRPVQLSWSTPVLVEADGQTELVTNGHEHIIAYDPATGRELWRVKGLEGGAMHTPLISAGLVIVSAGCQGKRVVALRPGTAVPPAQRIAWTYAKGTGCPLSNIAYRGTLFLFTESGILTTLDASTGAVTAQGTRPPAAAKFTASPVAFEGLVAITSEEGDTFMIRAGPAPTFIGQNPIGEGVRASAALANGRIYLRGDKHLIAIGR